jgi:hypothetical protein
VRKVFTGVTGCFGAAVASRSNGLGGVKGRLTGCVYLTAGTVGIVGNCGENTWTPGTEGGGMGLKAGGAVL